MNPIKLLTLLSVFAAALLLSCDKATTPEEEEPLPFWPHPDGAELK